jgi:hypothetical protein
MKNKPRIKKRCGFKLKSPGGNRPKNYTIQADETPIAGESLKHLERMLAGL